MAQELTKARETRTADRVTSHAARAVPADRTRAAAYRLPLLMLDATGMRVGAHVGQRDLAVTATTYSHVFSVEMELDYGGMLG